MKVTPEIEKYLTRSVLCWLATCSRDGQPNVSPKEVFTAHEDTFIIIANIASPQTVKNILENAKVCISFVDVLVQKGMQLKGSAKIIDKHHAEFSHLETPLLKITKGLFPFSSITKISIDSAKAIIAPRYLIYPNTTEEEQVSSAKKQYGV